MVNNSTSFEQRGTRRLWKWFLRVYTLVHPRCRLLELPGITALGARTLCFCTAWSKHPQSCFCQVALLLISPDLKLWMLHSFQKCFQCQLQSQSCWGKIRFEGSWRHGLGFQDQMQCFVVRLLYLLLYFNLDRNKGQTRFEAQRKMGI